MIDPTFLSPKGRNEDERRLLRLFRALEPGDRRTLLAFAAFLEGYGAETEAAPREPELLPRPPQENVVAAIRRLSQSYPMLERSALIGEASSLMSAHLLQGRAAADVIDELEALFARYYAAYRDSFSNDGS
ncbi:hypothetical protein Thimo_2634 [Thioflavicoccus mobilis 8321]|uniref:Crp/Fnr family transcriptional regulator n=1 Tax=Thioflavicoccus mobilis 8321 TaxID=765912 RepID=L0H188_9GAMM|nr:hypothetical protein [Thioflavicoccus mobilis]AGA91354.1 hypothetical protein Thimo_2634 [Thioflavicoccus mobilis 8321]